MKCKDFLLVQCSHLKTKTGTTTYYVKISSINQLKVVLINLNKIDCKSMDILTGKSMLFLNLYKYIQIYRL